MQGSVFFLKLYSDILILGNFLDSSINRESQSGLTWLNFLCPRQAPWQRRRSNRKHSGHCFSNGWVRSERIAGRQNTERSSQLWNCENGLDMSKSAKHGETFPPGLMHALWVYPSINTEQAGAYSRRYSISYCIESGNKHSGRGFEKATRSPASSQVFINWSTEGINDLNSSTWTNRLFALALGNVRASWTSLRSNFSARSKRWDQLWFLA